MKGSSNYQKTKHNQAMHRMQNLRFALVLSPVMAGVKIQSAQDMKLV
ncbi:MAG: hypothetical protein H5U05_12150 [Candidatus Aminicenantes bacterium]|nr:hypothetical protein [Candidatus Aminicenantes bacterium]